MTASGLLTGLERWLAVRDLLDHDTCEEIGAPVRQVHPLLARPNSS